VASSDGHISLLYYANDATLLGISLLQGLVFVWWRESQAPIRRG